MMRIAVLVKASVPLLGKLRVDRERGTLIREGPLGLNPWDRDAVEVALRVRDKYGGSVTAVSMAPPSARTVMEELVAMGVDEAVVISDKAVAGSDVLATARVLAAALETLGRFDLIIAGEESVDSATGGVAAEVAAMLQLPYLYYVIDIIEVANGSALIRRVVVEEGVEEIYETRLPLVASILKGSQNPRTASIGRRIGARNRVRMIGLRELGLDPTCVGLQGSATTVVKLFEAEPPARRGEDIRDSELGARVLINELARLGLATRQISSATQQKPQ